MELSLLMSLSAVKMKRPYCCYLPNFKMLSKILRRFFLMRWKAKYFKNSCLF